MQLNEKHIKTIKMFNQAFYRSCFHKKRKIRKKNRQRALYMIRRGNQIPRKEWRKYIRK